MTLKPLAFFRTIREMEPGDRLYVYNRLAPPQTPPAKYARRFERPIRPRDLREVWPVGDFVVVVVRRVEPVGSSVRYFELCRTYLHGKRGGSAVA